MMTEQTAQPSKLSTFAGVFTPNILTILGVIMFLRMGFVVGNAGLINALIILAFAHIVSLTTTFSLSAITTNMSSIEGGGDYYIISHSIGIENGGAIGVVLYIAQTISIAMYIIGFSDVLVSIFPIFQSIDRWISLIMLGVLFLPTYRGADIAAKIQTGILVVLTFSILTFVVSAVFKFDIQLLQANLAPQYLDGYSFWIVFALFFPAVTGFTQGVSMSGALKDPLKSIPLGTFVAVLSGLAVYGLEMVLLAGSASSTELLTNYNVMAGVSLIPVLIVLGIFSATISSALGSFMGAPLILEAIGSDKLFPLVRFFKQKEGDATPKRAVIFTAFIAGVCIWFGDLNTIAPIISMFFLLSYGMTNYATFIEGYSKNPSFRPTFSLNHWSISLLGLVFIGFLVIMISPLSGAFSLLFLLGIKAYLANRTGLKDGSFRDAHGGYYFQRVKNYLVKLQNTSLEFKNWRPQILLLSGNPEERRSLIQMGKLLEAHKGALSLIRVIESDRDSAWGSQQEARKEMNDFVQANDIDILGDVIVSESYAEGLRTIIQAYGFQGMRPNTLLMGWSDKSRSEKTEYMKFIQFSYQFGKNILIAESKSDQLQIDPNNCVIDIWWRGKSNGALMLMFAYLIWQQMDHRQTRIRILRIVKEKAQVAMAQRILVKLLKKARIKGEVKILLQSEQSIEQTICEESKSATIVFLGLSWEEKEKDFLRKYEVYRQAFDHLVLLKSHETLGILE